MEYMNDFFIQAGPFPWWAAVLIISVVILFGVGLGAFAFSDSTIADIKAGAATGATIAGAVAIIAAAGVTVTAPRGYDTEASASSLGDSVQEAYGLDLTDGVLELLVESVESPGAVVEGEVARFGSVEVAATDGSSAVVQLTWHGSGWVLTAEDGDPLEPLVDGSWQ